MSKAQKLTSVENAVHDVLEKGLEGREDELGVGVLGGGEEVD